MLGGEIGFYRGSCQRRSIDRRHARSNGLPPGQPISVGCSVACIDGRGKEDQLVPGVEDAIAFACHPYCDLLATREDLHGARVYNAHVEARSKQVVAGDANHPFLVGGYFDPFLPAGYVRCSLWFVLHLQVSAPMRSSSIVDQAGLKKRLERAFVHFGYGV